MLEKTGAARFLQGCRTIVDLGCGTGHVGEAMLGAERRARLIMVDPAWRPSPRLCRRLDENAPGRWQHLTARAQDLPLDDGSVDLVLLAFVLHHTGPALHESILDEVWRILRPLGRLVLVEDTPRGRRETRRTLLADRILNGEITPGPHSYRTAEAWSTLLAAAGFRVEEQSCFRGIPPRVTCNPVPHSCLVAKKVSPAGGKSALARP